MPEDWDWDDVVHRLDGDPDFCPCHPCKAGRAKLLAEHEEAARTIEIPQGFRTPATKVVLPPPLPPKPWWKLW